MKTKSVVLFIMILKDCPHLLLLVIFFTEIKMILKKGSSMDELNVELN